MMTDTTFESEPSRMRKWLGKFVNFCDQFSLEPDQNRMKRNSHSSARVKQHLEFKDALNAQNHVRPGNTSPNAAVSEPFSRDSNSHPSISGLDSASATNEETKKPFKPKDNGNPAVKSSCDASLNKLEDSGSDVSAASNHSDELGENSDSTIPDARFCDNLEDELIKLSQQDHVGKDCAAKESTVLDKDPKRNSTPSDGRCSIRPDSKSSGEKSTQTCASGRKRRKTWPQCSKPTKLRRFSSRARHGEMGEQSRTDAAVLPPSSSSGQIASISETSDYFSEKPQNEDDSSRNSWGTDQVASSTDSERSGLCSEENSSTRPRGVHPAVRSKSSSKSSSVLSSAKKRKDTVLQKIFQGLHTARKTKLSKKAESETETLLMNTGDCLVRIASMLVEFRNKKVLSAKDLEMAVKLTFPPRRRLDCMSYVKAVTEKKNI